MPKPNLTLANSGSVEAGRARFVLEILMAQAIGQRQEVCPIENCGGTKSSGQVVCPECFRAFGGWKVVNWLKGVKSSLYAQQVLGDLYQVAVDDAYDLLKSVRVEDDADIQALIIAALDNTRHPDNHEQLAFEIEGRTREEVLQALTIVWNRALHNLQAMEEKNRTNNLLFEEMKDQVEKAVPLGDKIDTKSLPCELYRRHKPPVAETQAIKMFTAACFKVIEARRPKLETMKQSKLREKAAGYAATVANFSKGRGRKQRQGVPGAGPNANSGLGKKRQRGGRQRDRRWDE